MKDDLNISVALVKPEPSMDDPLGQRGRFAVAIKGEASEVFEAPDRSERLASASVIGLYGLALGVYDRIMAEGITLVKRHSVFGEAVPIHQEGRDPRITAERELIERVRTLQDERDEARAELAETKARLDELRRLFYAPPVVVTVDPPPCDLGGPRP